MSDRINLSSQLMNMDLSTVQTAFPLIAQGLYVLRVAEIKEEQNKAGDGSNLKIKLVTTEVAQATVDGNPTEVQPGYPLFHTISLVQTEKYDPRKNLATFMEATLGHRNGAFMPLEQYLNTEATCKIVHEGTADGQYGIQARINRFVKKG